MPSKKKRIRKDLGKKSKVSGFLRALQANKNQMRGLTEMTLNKNFQQQHAFKRSFVAAAASLGCKLLYCALVHCSLRKVTQANPLHTAT
jgi:hypothetical protein